MSRCKYLLVMIIGVSGFSCKYLKSTVLEQTGRVNIKFCSRAKTADRKNFLNKFFLTPVASDVFGYDVAEWRGAPPDLKNEKSPFGCPAANSRQKIIIEDYEIEKARLTGSLPKRRPHFLSKQGCLSDKEIAYWPEKFIQTEAAHWFLKTKGIPLWPNGIVVADEGFDFTHPDIKPALKYDENKKPIYWINPAMKIRQQVDFHATLVSCLAAGYRDGKGIDGVAAAGSYILPLALFFDPEVGSFYSDIAIGLAYFQKLERQGKISFNVVNMSFHMANSGIVRGAMERLSDKLFVIAAGNSGDDGIQRNIDEKKIYPAGWKLPNIIAVAATDYRDTLADFSNYGQKKVDIAAPGKSVFSCQKGGYGEHSGTSFAAPLVSGALSLLFSIDPFMNSESAKQALLLGAEERFYLRDKVRLGKRLNVYNSVRLVHNIMYEFSR